MKTLFDALRDIYSVTKALQKDAVTMFETSLLLDEVFDAYCGAILHYAARTMPYSTMSYPLPYFTRFAHVDTWSREDRTVLLHRSSGMSDPMGIC